MTIILFGSMERADDYGDSVSNGGYKLQALWIKALRSMGHAAYRITRDGTLTNWLIETPPVVSLDTARAWAREGQDLRIVTTWLASEVILDLMPRAYYFDAELAHTISGHHFAALERRFNSLKIATHSRTQQAWYMQRYGFTPLHIQEWSDVDYWNPGNGNAPVRDNFLVGYMDEGPHTQQHINIIRQTCQRSGVLVNFRQIRGVESDVIQQMRECTVFIGLNPGKDALWGEGCPRAQQEAMHAGCVVVGYDVHGNREYLMDGYTGLLARRGDPEHMGALVARLLNTPDERERLRARSTDFIQRQFCLNDQRKQAIKEFLDLC